jgi:HAAS
MTIEAYLAELSALLPSTRRSRFLSEVEAHLHEAAAARMRLGVERRAAEAEAVESFGPPDVVASRMWRETAPVAVRRAAAVALIGLGALVLPLYVVPENLLPPAPWTERPGYLGVLLVTALVTWAFAGVHAVVAFFAPAAHGACALMLAAAYALACGLAGLAAAVAWHVEAPGTPWSVTAIAAPLTVTALAAVATAAAWARRRVTADA